MSHVPGSRGGARGFRAHIRRSERPGVKSSSHQLPSTLCMVLLICKTAMVAPPSRGPLCAEVMAAKAPGASGQARAVSVPLLPFANPTPQAPVAGGPPVSAQVLKGCGLVAGGGQSALRCHRPPQAGLSDPNASLGQAGASVNHTSACSAVLRCSGAGDDTR